VCVGGGGGGGGRTIASLLIITFVTCLPIADMHVSINFLCQVGVVVWYIQFRLHDCGKNCGKILSTALVTPKQDAYVSAYFSK
jgi:hypothetical protein